MPNKKWKTILCSVSDDFYCRESSQGAEPYLNTAFLFYWLKKDGVLLNVFTAITKYSVVTLAYQALVGVNAKLVADIELHGVDTERSCSAWLWGKLHAFHNSQVFILQLWLLGDLATCFCSHFSKWLNEYLTTQCFTALLR